MTCPNGLAPTIAFQSALSFKLGRQLHSGRLPTFSIRSNGHLRCIGVLLLTLLQQGCSSETNADREIDRGMELYAQREYEQAITVFDAALSKNFSAYSRSDVLTVLGNCYYEIDELDTAIDYHNRAIEADPTNHRAFVNKGIVYRLMGEYDAAKAEYMSALELAPDYAELHGSLGALALVQGDYQAALQYLERCNELDGSLPVGHSNLALVYAELKRFDEAEVELKKAIELGYHQPELIRQRIDEARSRLIQQ